MPYNAAQKRKWFRDREGVLFGFGAAFFVMIKIPLVGVLVYGIAEASTAYLLTKITDPPPPPPSEAERAAYIETQVPWRNKTKFLSLDMAHWDGLNVVTGEKEEHPLAQDVPVKKFT